MSYRKDREQFIASMARISAGDIAWRLLKEATTLNRISELQCSSEAADRDRVPCPKRYQSEDACLCRDYGSFDDTECKDVVCHHGTVPRVNVQEAHAERRVMEALALAVPSLVVEFQGDPRGWPMVVKLADDPGRGIGVPNGPSGIRW